VEPKNCTLSFWTKKVITQTPLGMQLGERGYGASGSEENISSEARTIAIKITLPNCTTPISFGFRPSLSLRCFIA